MKSYCFSHTAQWISFTSLGDIPSPTSEPQTWPLAAILALVSCRRLLCAGSFLHTVLLCCAVPSLLGMPNSLWPHELWPSRLLCPWGFSGQEHWSVLHQLKGGQHLGRRWEASAGVRWARPHSGPRHSQQLTRRKQLVLPWAPQRPG